MPEAVAQFKCDSGFHNAAVKIILVLTALRFDKYNGELIRLFRQHFPEKVHCPRISRLSQRSDRLLSHLLIRM